MRDEAMEIYENKKAELMAEWECENELAKDLAKIECWRAEREIAYVNKMYRYGILLIICFAVIGISRPIVAILEGIAVLGQ